MSRLGEIRGAAKLTLVYQAHIGMAHKICLIGSLFSVSKRWCGPSMILSKLDLCGLQSELRQMSHLLGATRASGRQEPHLILAQCCQPIQSQWSLRYSDEGLCAKRSITLRTEFIGNGHLLSTS